MQEIITESIIQSMPIGALAINQKGEITIANKAAADILGLPMATIMANGWGELFIENQSNWEFNQVLVDVIWQKPLNLHRKVSYVRPNGKIIHLSVTSSFLRENNELAGITVLLDDITEIHDLHLKEKAWLEERNRLEKEKAEALFRLSLAVAHQLRNPTAAIGGLANLIQKKNTEPVVKDYSTQIVNCVRRLEEIVKAVEDYISIPAIEQRPIQAQDIFAEIQNYAKKLTESSGKEINWLFQVQPLNIRGDAKLLFRALQELLKNSVENIVIQGTIEISFKKQESNWFIKILDNGCGIAPENLPFIFNPFFSTKVLGVGMGLCVAQKIINDHGGNLIIENHPGRGTQILVQFPEEQVS
jgi:PAS domain S-box-containing protein